MALPCPPANCPCATRPTWISRRLEGLGDPDELHPLQQTFLEEQAAQCGFCTAGMIIAAQGLLNSMRYPTDDDIRAALSQNLCRCGVYDRVRRAIKLRIGQARMGPDS